MAVKLTKQNVIRALGLRFWMNAMEDLGISHDVTKCIILSQHLHGVISNNQQVKICRIEDNKDNEDLFLTCFAYGVQFWEQVVTEHDIREVNHCKTVLEYYQRVLREYDLNNTEEKIQINSNANLDDIHFDDSPPNSPAQTKNVLIKFKKTTKKYIYPKKNSKEYKCDYCEKAFWHFEQAETHMERKHPDLKDEFDKKYLVYKCEWGCSEAFNTSKRLIKHYKLIHKIIKCDYCPEESATLFSALNHINEVHPEMKTEFDVKFRVHKCNIEGCDKNFFTEKGLSKHRVKVHRIRRSKKIQDSEDSSSTLCSDCGASFQTFKELKKHRSTHNKREYSKTHRLTPKACRLCGETFIGNYRLTIHMFKVHDVGALVCDDCGEKFQREREFKSHKEKKHLKIKFECKFCEKSFNVERYLDRHMKRVHTSNEERKYKCDQCGKGFNCKETFVGHMNMHLGLKPFKCEYCGAAYQNKSNLLAHLKKSCKNITNV